MAASRVREAVSRLGCSGVLGMGRGFAVGYKPRAVVRYVVSRIGRYFTIEPQDATGES